MKRIAILTKDDFINPDVADQNVFLATPKQPFNEMDFEVIIYEGKVIANRYGEIGDLSVIDFEKLVML